MQNQNCSPTWTESERLAALEGYSILDTPREQDFDEVVQLVCQMLDAPIGAINLIARERQWFKAEVGLGVREMPLDASVCVHALLQQDCMVVPDMTQDARFRGNPLVTGTPGLRFYAGELLKSPEGHPLGTICVLDTRPRPEGITPAQRLLLRTLGKQIMTQLELRRSVEKRDELLAQHTAVEAQLRSSEQRLAATFHQASVGMAECSPEGTFLRVNEVFCSLLGRSEAELRGMTFLDVTADADLATSRYSAQHVLESGRPLKFEKRYRHSDGREFWASTDVARLVDAAGRPQGFIAVVIDISQRKQAEGDLQRLATELAEANRRQTEFLATLAHELRNPLAPIRSGIEVMRLAGDNPAVVRKMQEMVERQLSHMVHLIDDLLDVARINSGKLELRKERIELQNVLATAVETSMPLIQAGHHDLAVDILDEPLIVHADATRIAQVVSNLLNNAAKYTPTGGRIRLSARREQDEAVISVADNGQGLPPESLSAIFEMFTQVRSRDQAQSGLGIGLTLVRRLVEYHQGTVCATSAGPGQGSTFTVRLPLSGSEPHRPLDPRLQHYTHGSDSDSAKRLKILVVDDNQDAARSLAVFLEIKGHEVQVAHGGTSALELAQAMRPDLVLLDIGMPDMDGYQVAQTLRATESAGPALLVALTGWGSEIDRTRSLDAGFNYHLTKPAPPAQLESILASVQPRNA